MDAERRTVMQNDLRDIPSIFFPIWNDTLGYPRGLPHFRVPPEFSEEGVLVPGAGGYDYQPLLRRVAPPSSQSSPTMQVEAENDSPSVALPSSYETGGTSQTPSGEGCSYDMDIAFNAHTPQHNAFPGIPRYNLGNQSTMDTSSYTSVPHDMQLCPEVQYLLGHDGSMAPPQTDIEMAELFGLVPRSTPPPYGTDPWY